MNINKTFSGRLSSAIYPMQLVPSEPHEIILRAPEDFFSINRLLGTKSNVLLMTVKQNYRMLVDIINTASENIPEITYFLCTAQMPGGCRIPKRLLQDDVFLVQELETEKEFLLEQGHCLLSIDNKIVRDSLEAENNVLEITLYGGICTELAWKNLENYIVKLGFLEVTNEQC